jgi:hypothetical protein
LISGEKAGLRHSKSKPDLTRYALSARMKLGMKADLNPELKAEFAGVPLPKLQPINSVLVKTHDQNN